MAERVVIVGGGLAGLATAVALAPRGFAVTVLESRNRLGGRAGSFHDPTSGQLIDACQHVSMGCCTNFAHFCRTVMIDHFLQPQRRLYFMTPDRRVSAFQADHFPAPLHLARSFLGSHLLTLHEKLRVGWALLQLQRMKSRDDPPFLTWLQAHGQTPRIVDHFWGPILTSALNEVPERVGLRYARKVFVDGFLTDRRGFEVQLPCVPLGRLYGRELKTWLAEHGVECVYLCGVKQIHLEGDRVARLEVRDGTRIVADWYVSAVPFDRLLDLLPEDVVEASPVLRKLQQLEISPITSVHLWYDRPILPLPHVVLIDCVGQWVFGRGESNLGEHYVQVVVSAARQFRGLGHEEVQRRIVAELAQLFPIAASAILHRAKVVTEHAATFSAVPGVDQFRPAPNSPIDNLFLAGDWTNTGWPATMEGAVRSGYLAAEALLGRRGQSASLVQPDL